MNRNITIDTQKLVRSQNGNETEYTLPGNEEFYIVRRQGEDNCGNPVDPDKQYIVLCYSDGHVAGLISDGSDATFRLLGSALAYLNSLTAEKRI